MCFCRQNFLKGTISRIDYLKFQPLLSVWLDLQVKNCRGLKTRSCYCIVKCN